MVKAVDFISSLSSHLTPSDTASATSFLQMLGGMTENTLGKATLQLTLQSEFNLTRRRLLGATSATSLSDAIATAKNMTQSTRDAVFSMSRSMLADTEPDEQPVALQVRKGRTHRCLGHRLRLKRAGLWPLYCYAALGLLADDAVTVCRCEVVG